MSEITTNSIPKQVATNDDRDFAFLRKQGQQHIEELAGKIWTDYNSHDPGMTMLDLLCYALTDLALRMEMPMADLLAADDQAGRNFAGQFFFPNEIFPSKPVTEADYRKLFIDLDGVKNCWLQPYTKPVWLDCKQRRLSYKKEALQAEKESDLRTFDLNGLYRILLEYDDDIDKDSDRNRVKREVKARYHANRNLCEDLVEVDEVALQKIGVCAQIELEPEADEEWVHAKIRFDLQNYLSPALRFYSLKQMLEKGCSMDRIFEGPLLNHGFIDDDELAASGLRTEVRLSDVMQVIMAVKGVKNIRDISINKCGDDNRKQNEWLICIAAGTKPEWCPDSILSYFKGFLPVNINQSKTESYLQQMHESARLDEQIDPAQLLADVPENTWRAPAETTTMMNDLPDTYGVGRRGLPAGATPQRSAQAKQLKGYLLFFDQMLAVYFAHLGKLKDLLAVSEQPAGTWFAQAIADVKGLDELVSDYPADGDALAEKLFGELVGSIERKQQVLDHLIARFAERFADYAFLMKQLYGNLAAEEVLATKQDFLRDYPLTSSTRGSAFNFYKQEESHLWNTDNISGFQRRLARLTGIRDYTCRNLSETGVEFYDPDQTDAQDVTRWRIRNRAGHIVLSATENYPSRQQAEAELFLASLKIMETDPDEVEEAFTRVIRDEDEVGNFEIQLSPAGKYSFDVIDRSAAPASTKRIIARQYTYYQTQDELKAAILSIIRFMRFEFTEEGLFVLEHSLLRPNVTADNPPAEQFMPVCGTTDCDGCEPADPYSFRVTVVLTGWTYRFMNLDFRRFMEDLIRRELPAHVLARICWVGERDGFVPDDENRMKQFEQAYREWLFAKTDKWQVQPVAELKNLLHAHHELTSVYPSGRLMDCSDEDDDLKGRIVLGRTNIGNH